MTTAFLSNLKIKVHSLSIPVRDFVAASLICYGIERAEPTTKSRVKTALWVVGAATVPYVALGVVLGQPLLETTVRQVTPVKPSKTNDTLQ